MNDSATPWPSACVALMWALADSLVVAASHPGTPSRFGDPRTSLGAFSSGPSEIARRALCGWCQVGYSKHVTLRGASTQGCGTPPFVPRASQSFSQCDRRGCALRVRCLFLSDIEVRLPAQHCRHLATWELLPCAQSTPPSARSESLGVSPDGVLSAHSGGGGWVSRGQS